MENRVRKTGTNHREGIQAVQDMNRGVVQPVLTIVETEYRRMVEELEGNLRGYHEMYYDTFGDRSDDASGDTYYEILNSRWRRSLRLHKIKEDIEEFNVESRRLREEHTFEEAADAQEKADNATAMATEVEARIAELSVMERDAFAEGFFREQVCAQLGRGPPFRIIVVAKQWQAWVAINKCSIGFTTLSHSFTSTRVWWNISITNFHSTNHHKKNNAVRALNLILDNVLCTRAIFLYVGVHEINVFLSSL